MQLFCRLVQVTLFPSSYSSLAPTHDNFSSDPFKLVDHALFKIIIMER